MATTREIELAHAMAVISVREIKTYLPRRRRFAVRIDRGTSLDWVLEHPDIPNRGDEWPDDARMICAETHSYYSAEGFVDVYCLYTEKVES